MNDNTTIILLFTALVTTVGFATMIFVLTLRLLAVYQYLRERNKYEDYRIWESLQRIKNTTRK